MLPQGSTLLRHMTFAGAASIITRFRRELAAGMVDGIVPRQDQLADGHHRIAVVDEIFQNPRQGLRSMERSVMEQHDAARLHLGGDPLIDGIRVIVLPVQTVPTDNELKPLVYKG